MSSPHPSMHPQTATGRAGTSPSLRAVEARLSDLAEQAASARERVAGTEAAGALDRIGAGMARLADDVSATGAMMDEGWSRDDAEALTRLYEHENPMAWPPVAPPSNAPSTQSRPGPSAPLGNDADRVWLDARLADIAARVDKALAAAAPEAGFTALGARLDRFEARFGEAVAALDQRPDMAAFQRLEAQMVDISADVQATRRQVMRLDGLEHRLQKLTDLAQAATAPAVDAEPGAHAAAPVDVEALMARLSAQLSDMRQTTLAAADGDPRLTAHAEGLAEVRRLLDVAVTDQKTSASATAALLETMQEALIRLIDRIEEATEDAEVEEATATEPARAQLSAALDPMPAPKATVAPPSRSAAPDPAAAPPAEPAPPALEPAPSVLPSRATIARSHRPAADVKTATA